MMLRLMHSKSIKEAKMRKRIKMVVVRARHLDRNLMIVSTNLLRLLKSSSSQKRRRKRLLKAMNSDKTLHGLLMKPHK